MDTAILSAASALAGSLIGGVSTLIASWLTQRGQLRAQALIHEAVKRETLYSEFISEASKRRADAWSHHAGTLSLVSTPRLNGCACPRPMKSSALPSKWSSM